MRKIYLMFALILMIGLFAGCGGDKKLTGEVLTEGTMIGYAPAEGQTLHYRSDSDELTEFTEKGYHSSTLSKTTSYEAFTVDSVNEEGVTAVTYSFLSSETGVFQNGQFQIQDEEDELIGQSLTIVVGPEGDLLKWSGLEDLEITDSGMDRGEMMASNYASIFFDHFPTDRKLKIGDTWKRENSMNVSTKEGEMNQKTTKTYTVENFVIRDGHKCAKCDIKIIIENTGEGTTENEGKTYNYYNEGRGEGNGTLYFDFENGYPVYSSHNWIVDFTITSVETQTQEENSFSYYQEQKVTNELVPESEIPE